jgi:hypothetical protein
MGVRQGFFVLCGSSKKNCYLLQSILPSRPPTVKAISL